MLHHANRKDDLTTIKAVNCCPVFFVNYNDNHSWSIRGNSHFSLHEAGGIIEEISKEAIPRGLNVHRKKGYFDVDEVENRLLKDNEFSLPVRDCVLIIHPISVELYNRGNYNVFLQGIRLNRHFEFSGEDDFPRYYYDLEAMLTEIEAWLRRRKQI